VSIEQAQTKRRDEPRLSFPRAVHGEWIKFSSLRSSWWLVGASTFISIAYAILTSWVLGRFVGGAPTAANGGSGAMNGLRSTDALSSGAVISQLIFSVLAAMFITTEYRNGTIRSTLAAVPRRSWMLLAKAVVMGATAFALSFVTSWLSLVVSAPFGGKQVTNNVFSVQALHVTAGIALAAALVAIFGLAVGSLMRHTAGAITSIAVFLYLISNLLIVLPWQWARDVGQILPGNAGRGLSSLSGSDGLSRIMGDMFLSFWPGLLASAAWAALPLLLALILLQRRDA
jgi:ABC-2 type transport system permease protein